MMLFVLYSAVYAQAQQAGGAATAAPAASVAAQPSAQSAALPQMTPQQAGAYQSLSPAQQQAVQAELGKTGGQITPPAVEALKGRPEFKDITPSEIEKGRQLLEQKEKAPDKAAEKAAEKAADEGKAKDKDKIEKKNLPWEEKRSSASKRWKTGSLIVRAGLANIRIFLLIYSCSVQISSGIPRCGW